MTKDHRLSQLLASRTQNRARAMTAVTARQTNSIKQLERLR